MIRIWYNVSAGPLRGPWQGVDATTVWARETLRGHRRPNFPIPLSGIPIVLSKFKKLLNSCNMFNVIYGRLALYSV